MTRKTGLVWLLLLFCTAVRASNLRQISSREGISNNAILSLAQDKHGFIWVGSCDGLNMWDGERMRLFPNDWGGETPLSGNLIEEIAVTTDSLFWIRTNYGLDLFDPDSKRVERHADFQGMYKIVTRRSNEVLVVTQDNKFSCYDPAARRFSSVQPMSGIDYADILDMQLDDDGALWVFSRKGIFRIPVAFPDKNNDRIGIGQPERFPTVSNPEYAFAENGSGFFIDENHIFYEFDIRERRLIYNKAWALFTGVKPMDKEQALKILNTLRPIIDPNIIFFAYFNDEPIGFFIMVPDLNRLIGRFNGRFGWRQKLRLMWDLKVTKRCDRIFGIIFGITPEFHGKGVESGMMCHILENYVRTDKNHYKTIEFAWIGDFNPVMNRMIETYVCATRHKMHTTYRYLFDRSREFRRCPRLGVKRRE